MPTILQLLREDHNRVKNLFQDFDAAEDTKTKQKIVETASMELMAHTQLEEEMFYPNLGREGKEAVRLIDVAEEEHHVAKFLISELADMNPNTPRYDAKFLVLAEAVKNHIQQEETVLFEQAEKMGKDRLENMGEMFTEERDKIRAQMTRSRRRAA